MLGTILWNSGSLGTARAWNPITWTPTGGALTRTLVGAAIRTIPAHSLLTLAGNALGAFGDDFYNRFHITKLLLDLGNLITSQTQNITVWNAYRRSWILTSLAISNSEGITVTGQPVPPLQFNPLQERIYAVGISTDGPPQIDSNIAWGFSNGLGVTLHVIGQRIVLWNWSPDWSQPLLERLQWFTDVIQAGRGEEQRRALRIDPRQYLEFSCTVQGVDKRILEAILWNWGARAWAVPLWYDGQQLASQLTAGATTVPVSSSSRGYQVGELLVLTSGDPQTYEVLEVGALGSPITLARPTTLTWPAGTLVYPARAAVLDVDPILDRFTSEAFSTRLLWRCLEPTTWAAAASPTYRSSPVVEDLPNWSDDPTQAYERVVSVLDAQLGLTQINDNMEMPSSIQRMKYTLPTKALIDTWKQRLWALRGRQVAIWIPTWSQDLQVVADIGAAALNIDVRWVGYTKYLKMDPGRRDVRIVARDGTIYYRRITGSVEVSPTLERLSIDSALGGAGQTAANILMVSFMALSRSDSDTHEIAYFTGGVADTTFSARGFRTEQ